LILEAVLDKININFNWNIMLIRVNKQGLNCDFIRELTIGGAEYEYFLYGELYEIGIPDLLGIIVANNEKQLNRVLGNFTLVMHRKDSKQVKIISDRPGKKNIFYSVKNGECYISDDFWELKETLSLGLDDIDTLALKQQLVFSHCLGDKTILKDVGSVPAATILDIYFETSVIKKNRYWYFRYSSNSLSYDDKLDLMDETLNKSFSIIKSLNPNEKSYALGVSGGMDSRIIPHYASKNDMEIEGFTIGLERPRKIFLSNDFNSANKIADYFGIERKTVNFDSLSFEEQLQRETDLIPEVSSQIFKIINPDSIKSNVMITGASGSIVGASPLYSSILNTDLIEHTLRHLSLLAVKPKGSKYKKAISYLTGLSLDYKPRVVDNFNLLLTKDELEQSISEISSFYNGCEDMSNSEKILNFTIFGLGKYNDKGAFESLLGCKKSYSIYTPFFLDIIDKFSEEDMLDRKLFQNFIADRLPHLAAIQGQTYKSSLNKQSFAGLEAFRKVMAMGNFVIRGNGVMNYEEWVKSSEFLALHKKLLDKSSELSESIGLSFDYGLEECHPGLKLNILKMQNILCRF
jgi:asparagine synthase (glutamine-hydrolysing)